MEQTLRDECRERDVLTIFLHLLLGILRTLECEVLEPGQHPAPGVHSTHQLVGGAKGHSEGQVLGVVPGPDGGHNACGSLQPSNNLQSPRRGQLRVLKQ